MRAAWQEAMPRRARPRTPLDTALGPAAPECRLSRPLSLPVKPRNVVALGSTGSIGVNCLDVIAHLPDRLAARGLSAHGNWQQLFDQASVHKPRWVTITDPDGARTAAGTRPPKGCEVLYGEEGVARMVSDPETDVVVSAIVGAAGLAGTWAALQAGKTVALANKETLVVAGSLVMPLAAERGPKLLPVDSEHSAIFQ